MDRDLPAGVVRGRQLKLTMYIAIGIAVLFLLLFLTKRFLKPSIDLNTLQTSEAQIGTIENTISASGEVIPASEEAIVSPITASIRKVVVSVGAKVNAGDRIIELDKSFVTLELERLKGMLELKQNDVIQLQMKLEKELFDAKIADEIKSLSINRLKADLDYTRKLERAGGNTKEEVTTAENSLRIAELEKRQLENEVAYNIKSMESKLIDSKLQAQIQNNNVQELQQKFQKADIVAEQPSVVTWVNDQIGSSVDAGDIMAKLANLNSFKIEGACSDLYLDQVKPGLEVSVRFSGANLRGTITQVRPTIKNNVVNFAVELDNKQADGLRPNMKVELFIVTNRNKRAIRIKRGPAFNGRSRQNVFVIKNGEALKREIEIGESNSDWVEVKKGLTAGEEVIISKMENYENVNKLSIR